MRKILSILLLLIGIAPLFSQEYAIPEIDWQGKTDEKNHYTDLLKLKDENALIIKIGYSSYWLKGEYSDLLVYQND